MLTIDNIGIGDLILHHPHPRWRQTTNHKRIGMIIRKRKVLHPTAEPSYYNRSVIIKWNEKEFPGSPIEELWTIDTINISIDEGRFEYIPCKKNKKQTSAT